MRVLKRLRLPLDPAEVLVDGTLIARQRASPLAYRLTRPSFCLLSVIPVDAQSVAEGLRHLPDLPLAGYLSVAPVK